MNPNVNNTQNQNNGVNGQLQQVSTQLQQVSTQPQQVSTQPQQVSTQPQQVGTQPQNVTPLPQGTGPTEINVNPSSQLEEVTVINTNKSKNSSTYLIIIVVALVLFVLNIDNIKELYEKYVSPMINPVATKNPSGNLVNGYILIGANSSTELLNIRFYEFKKSDNMELMLTYNSKESYDNIKDKKLYIELYNSNKELLHRQLFDAEEIKKGEIKKYSYKVDEDIYTDAYYAKVVDNSEPGKIETSTLVCKYTKDSEISKLEYEITYRFMNNELYEYNVNKKVITEEVENYDALLLKTEYDLVSTIYPATFENNNLNYIVNYNVDKDSEFQPEYMKGTIKTIVKNRETKKEWICE